MKRIQILGFLIAWLLMPSSSYAIDDASLKKQRNLFQQANKALQTNQISQFNKLKQKLSDYPLQPYLDYLYLRHRLSFTPNDNIIDFLTQNQNTFYAERLRSAWLNKLAKDKQWSLFLQYYQPTESSSQACYRLQALYGTGQHQQVQDEALKLWLVPRSQHKACDPIFEVVQKKGLLTNELRWQRIELALENRQFSLAKYLAKSVNAPKAANGWVTRWQKIHNKPLSLLKQLPAKASPSNPVSLTQDIPISRKIIAYGIKRLARESTQHAFATWQRIEPAYQFSQQQKRDIEHSIAMRAALNREPETLHYFGQISDEPWRVRAALWQQDWPAVQQAIYSLDSEQKNSHRWRYWLARSQEQMGNSVAAYQIYQSLIEQRDYYSFLAADKLNQSYQMNNKPITFEQDEIEQFSQQIDVARLREFYALNMSLEARRQAYHFKQNASPRQLQLLATLTHKWGWHNQSIALLGKAKYWDALDIRFPVIYDSAILKASKVNGIDPSWLFGIARQESAFNPHARSHVGATGLMQLMPKTGKLIARLINKPLKKTSELLNPNRNIELGSAYLRRVYDQSQQNPVLATASYNAGPHRVKRWLPPTALAADIWVENIPFTETRRYTRSVLSYAAIFDYQRNQPIKPLTDRMPIVNPQKP